MRAPEEGEMLGKNNGLESVQGRWLEGPSGEGDT